MIESPDTAEGVRLARWDRVSDIVIAALEAPLRQREPVIAAACAGDPELLAEVRSLLDHDSGATRVGASVQRQLARVGGVDGVLDGAGPGAMAVEGTPAGRADEAGASLEGLRIGAWRLCEKLGSGGMGVVYRAERADGVHHQVAAVKLLRGGGIERGAAARLRRERELLARLDHPGIARLIDGGETADGQPYLVMELVRGQPVDAWCRAQALGLDARLDLVLAVADAVQHAHQLLMIHRDLKPSNVVVDEQGRARLLDFGIARLVDDAFDSADTMAGVLPFTPRYASPEVLRANTATVATDVYGIGLLLYDLLAGASPFAAFEKPAPSNVWDSLQVVLNDPLRPASAVAALHGFGWARRLQGDLDRVLAKACARAPGDRYATVAALADDLRAWRRGAPVTAVPATRGYRLRRFVGRHRVPVAAGAFALLALLGGTALATWQAHEAAQARDMARRQFDRTRTLAGQLVFKYHEQLAPLAGAGRVREAILTDAAGYLDALQAEAGDDPALARENAGAWFRIASLRGETFSPGLENLPAARRDLERARALLPLFVKPQAEAADLLLAADISLLAATVAIRIGDLDAAAARLQEARVHGERALAHDPDAPEAISRHATTLGRIGRLVGGSPTEANLGRPLDAEPYLRESLERFEALATRFPQQARRHLELAWARVGLAQWLATQARPGDAATLYDRARASADAALRLQPEDQHLHHQTLAIRVGLATTLALTGRHAEADALAREAVAGLDAELRDDPQNPNLLRDTAIRRLVDGRREMLAGHHDRAQATLREGVAAVAARRDGGDDYYLLRWQAEGEVWLARELAASGQPLAAEQAARRAVMLLQPPGCRVDEASAHLLRAQAYGVVARAAQARRDTAAADEAAQAARDAWRWFESGGRQVPAQHADEANAALAAR